MFLRAEQLGLMFPKKPAASPAKREPVQHPGVRGGTGYYDPHGIWRYGTPPDTPIAVEPSPVTPPSTEPVTLPPVTAVEEQPPPAVTPPPPTDEPRVAAADAPPAEVPPAPVPEATLPEPPAKRTYDPRGADVPEGYYAVPSRTGKNDLDFYHVDVGREGGRWAGMRFVGRVLGGGGKPIKVSRTEQADALVRIQHYGIDESRARFGQAVGQCGRCGRSLTDAVSRAIGIGPECRKYMGEEIRKLVVPPVDPNMPERPTLADIPMPEAPAPTLEQLGEKPAEPVPAAEAPAPPADETALDALRDELKIRSIHLSNTETQRGRPALAMTGNTYAHNSIFQKAKAAGLIWGTKLKDGRFAWCTFEERAPQLLEFFNAERARRIRERDTGPGSGSGGVGGVRPAEGEPGGPGGGAAGVATGRVPDRPVGRDGGLVHRALTEEALDRMTNAELAAIQAPEPVTPLDPALANILYPAQQADVRLIADAWNRGASGFMLGNSTGTGKTFVGLGAMRQLGMPRTLVVVPGPAVAEQWINDGKVFGITVHDRLPESPAEQGVFVTTYAMLLKKAKEQAIHGQFGIVIPDEIHMMGMKLSSGKTIAKLIADMSGRSRMTIYSTASPYEAPHQMYYLRELKLWPPRKGAWREWAKRHGVRWVLKNIGRFKPPVEVAQWHGSRESKLHDILKVRAEIVGNGKGITRELELDPAVAPLTSNFMPVDQYHGEYGDTIKRALGAIHHLSSAAIKVNIQKRLLDYVKLDAAADEAAKAVAAGQHVVMMVSNKSPFRFSDPEGTTEKGAEKDKMPSRIREEIIGLFARAGLSGELPSPTELLRRKIAAKIGEKNVAEYTGDVSLGQRAKRKEAFNQGKLPVLVSTIAAGGTGLSLHDKEGSAPRTQINVGLPWTGRDFMQMLGRTYRYGTKSPVHHTFLWTDHPRERQIASVVAARLEALRAGVQGITSEKNVDKLIEFTVRGKDMEDDVAVDEPDIATVHGFTKAQAWLDKFFN